MNLVYLSAQTPYSMGETFIMPEVRELRRRGHAVTVIPIRPTPELAPGISPEGHLYVPLLGAKTLCLALIEFAARPKRATEALFALLRHSGSPAKLAKNLVVFPKGLATARLIRKIAPDHLHVHWISTPATVGYVAARMNRLPWSITAHRWDIGENNMIQEKAHQAAFVRVISAKGQTEIQDLCGEALAHKCHLVYMGVDLPQPKAEAHASPQGARPFTFACPANMVLKKGHAYLIEACRLLEVRGLDFECLLFGDGPLEPELRAQVEAAGLADRIAFRGRLPHEALLDLYRRQAIDLVVLPSIRTQTAIPEEEGIPVALMEAMAAGVPVISTPTGGTSELLGDDAGKLIPPEDAPALAEAIALVLRDPEERRAQIQRGRAKVVAQFSIQASVDALSALFAAASREGRHEP